MVLLSAAEDFAERTLSRIRGALARLQFVAALRDGNGNYQHWGMQKRHGAESTRKALQEAHRQAAADCLRTPIRQLAKEVADSGVDLGQAPALLLPAGASKATERHLSSVTVSLRALVRARVKAQTSHPTA